MQQPRRTPRTWPHLLGALMVGLLAACGGGGGGESNANAAPVSPPPAGQTGTWTVRLAWNASTDAGVYGYRVYHSTSAVDPNEQSDYTSTAEIDVNVTTGGTHYFSVAAVDAYNRESPRSQTIAVDLQ